MVEINHYIPFKAKKVQVNKIKWYWNKVCIQLRSKPSKKISYAMYEHPCGAEAPTLVIGLGLMGWGSDPPLDNFLFPYLGPLRTCYIKPKKNVILKV